MSILPLFFDSVNSPLEDSIGIRAHSNHFGIGLHPHDIHHLSSGLPIRCPIPQHWPLYKRSWVAKPRRTNQESSLATTTISKAGFQVCLDVEHFAPNEITVKTVDQTIIVEGRHAEKEDEHGNVYRHFVRRYTLPKEFDIRDVISTISSDGILTIKAPPPNAVESNERVIQIQQTGPAHLSIKSNNKENGKSEEKMSESCKL